MIRGWTSLLLVMIVLGTVGVGLPAYAAAQSRLPPCPADQMAQWDRCYGTYTAPNGDRYVGEYRDDKRNGQGTYTWPNGSKYVGEYRDGERNGQGTYTWPNGAKYVGEFRDDKKHGQGTLTYPNGDRYVGEFKDGERNGQGTLTAPNGDRYVGEYRDDKRNGQGTYTWPNGEKYVGEFRDGERNGQGTYTWPNGDRYVGEYRDDKRNGQGTSTFPNGAKYVGEYRDDKKHGEGTSTFPNGAKYVGEYRDDKRNGQGTLFSADGSTLQNGIFSADKFIQANNLPNPVIAAVRLVKEGGTFKVPVRINGVLELHFTVDSGAADVSIPADVVLTLIRTGTIQTDDFVGEQTYRLADGSTVKSKTFRIRQLQVGNRTVNNVLGSIADVDGSLLLGQSFLSRFKRVSFDYSQGVLVLE